MEPRLLGLTTAQRPARRQFSYYPGVSEDGLQACLSPAAHSMWPLLCLPLSRTFPEPLLPEKPKTITQNTGSGAQSWSGFQRAEAAPRRPQNPGATAPNK